MVAGLDENKNNFFNGGHVLIDRWFYIIDFPQYTIIKKNYLIRAQSEPNNIFASII